MSNREIYKKTLCFVWPRVPYAVIGTFVIIWTPWLIKRLFALMNVDLPRWISYVLIFLGLLLAKNLASWGTKPARVAQISMMTRGIVFGKMPKDVKTEGYRIARYHFNYIGLGEILKRAAAKLRNGGDFENDLVSFLFVFGANLTPWLGDCALAWQFIYPGRHYSETLCDSVEAMRRNWLKMLPVIAFNCIKVLLFVFFTALAIVFISIPIMENGGQPAQIMQAAASGAAESADYANATDFLVQAVFSMIVISSLYPFVKSRQRVRVLRTFFNAVDKNPPTGTIYRKYLAIKAKHGRANRTCVYVTDSSALDDDELFRRVYDYVPEERREKVDALRSRKDKNLSLAAGYLLQKHGGAACSNLSHSGERSMCIVSPCVCGCDVERIREVDGRIAERFFAKGEEGDFFRLWTLKESFIKCTGLGFRLPLNQFTILLDGDDIRIDQSVDSSEYRFFEFSRGDGYRYACCLKDPAPGVKPEFRFEEIKL